MKDDAIRVIDSNEKKKQRIKSSLMNKNVKPK